MGEILFTGKILTLIIILWVIDYNQLSIILKSIDLNLVLGAILLELSGFLVWAVKWKILVDRLRKVKFSLIFLGLMESNIQNTNVLRARTIGGFGRAAFLKKVTNDPAIANWYATVVMDQTTNSLVFSIPVVFSLLFIFLFMEIPLWLSILFEAIVLVLMLLALFAYLTKQKVKSSAARFFYFFMEKVYNFFPIKFIRNRFETYQIFEEALTAYIGDFIKTYRSILGDRRILKKDIFLSIIMFALIYLKEWIIFRSAGYDIPPANLIVSLSLIMWTSSILPIPGGLGIKELIMIGIYSIVGIPITTAAVVSMVDRVIYLFFVIVIAYSAKFLLNCLFDIKVHGKL